MADANREIDATVHEIDHTRTHIQANLHPRVAVKEIWQDWRDKGERKVCLDGYVQAARRTVREPTDGQPRHVEIRDDPMGMLEIDLARLGETLLARRPVKEPRTERPLQLGYLTGNRRGRDSKEAGGRRKAPFLHHAHK